MGTSVVPVDSGRVGLRFMLSLYILSIHVGSYLGVQDTPTVLGGGGVQGTLRSVAVLYTLGKDDAILHPTVL